MPRNILLVEPPYKTKFPPLGLMKISSYHKSLGDKVSFVKGYNENVAYEYWDRIYISTLFTFYWNVTVETIKYYKNLVRGDASRLFVGGIMAGLMKDDLWKETGIVPFKGVLNTRGMLGDNNDLIVDDMVPDYFLFDNTPHQYALLNSYLGYSTRGCVHRCPFCGVHLLEPRFVDYKGIKPYVEKIDQLYGKKQHLIFLDNNILYSRRFKKIISDILDLGFEKGARLNNRLRIVDFNQGVDVRLLNEKHLKLIASIAINPLRIAFDHIKLEKEYRKKIYLAAKHGIRDLSNYILYNYNDTPDEFWQRLKINIDLNKEYDLHIYSFPMKYIPLTARDRSFISKPDWNWQFIRNVQRILNVMKGSVMPQEDFFYRAFGSDEREFMTILHMPERILMSRGRESKEEEIDWLSKFNKLSKNDKKTLISTLCNNRTRQSLRKATLQTKSKKLKEILEYYHPEQVNGEGNLFAPN